MKVCKQAKLLTIAFILLLVSACSSTQQAYIQNIRLYYASNQDVALSFDQILSSPADLIYVKNGERRFVTMALAFIESGRYKWLSKDKAMIITAKGRLVRTVGFNQNLVFVSNLNQDPLPMGALIESGNHTWSRRIDNDVDGPSDRGAQISSQFQVIRDVSIVIQGITFSVVKVEESVAYTSVLYGKQEWTNAFWFDSETNQLLQSSQIITPNMDKLEISYVSRALRLLENKNAGAPK